MYNIIYEASCQSRLDARYWMLGAGALGRPRAMVRGGRRVQDGEHVYTCGRIHVDVWQNQYNIVKLKNKIKLNLKNMHSIIFGWNILYLSGRSIWLIVLFKLHVNYSYNKIKTRTQENSRKCCLCLLL